MKDQKIQQLGQPGRDLQPAGQPVRRRLRRLAADELHPGQARGATARGRHSSPASAGCRSAATRSRAGREPGRPVTLGVRPEHLGIGGGGTWHGFKVDIVEPMGADTVIWCSDGERTVQVRTPGDRTATPGRPDGPGRRSQPRLRCSPPTRASAFDRRPCRSPRTPGATERTHEHADELSIQLYSLREYGDLDRQLDALAELGFRRVETVGGHLADARATRAQARRARHQGADRAMSAWPTCATRPRLGGRAGRDRRDRAAVHAGVPLEEREGTPDAWRAVGAELGRMAERWPTMASRSATTTITGS